MNAARKPATTIGTNRRRNEPATASPSSAPPSRRSRPNASRRPRTGAATRSWPQPLRVRPRAARRRSQRVSTTTTITHPRSWCTRASRVSSARRSCARPSGSERIGGERPSSRRRRRRDVGDRDEAADPRRVGREDPVVAGADDHDVVALRIRVLSRRRETDVDGRSSGCAGTPKRGRRGSFRRPASEVAFDRAAPEGRDRAGPADRSSGSGT